MKRWEEIRQEQLSMTERYAVKPYPLKVVTLKPSLDKTQTAPASESRAAVDLNAFPEVIEHHSLFEVPSQDESKEDFSLSDEKEEDSERDR